MASMARSIQSRDISQIPRLTTPLVDIAVALPYSDRKKRGVIDRATECNVKIILPSVTVDYSLHNVGLCNQFRNEMLLFTAGVHPNYIPGSVARVDEAETRPLEQVIQDLREIARLEACVAIGETGLDYNRNPSTYKKQKKWCAEQVKLACEMNLPLFMHEREAFDDLDQILNQIRTEFGRLPPIVIHCFTGERWEAQRYIESGFYIGVTGFLLKAGRGKKLRGFMKDVIPLDKLLLETDSPYMSFGEKGQIDHRVIDFEKENEPCTMPVLALKVAELYHEDVEAVARITTVNAQRFYRRDFGVCEATAIAPSISLPASQVAIASQTQAEAPVSTSTLSVAEKEAMKLAKKLHQIIQLEELSGRGDTLSENQRVKLASKASVVAEFQIIMGTLPSTSNIIEKVQHVMIAVDGVQSEVEAVVEAALDATVVRDVECDVADEPCVIPAVDALAKANPTTRTGEPRRRPRGGRSGFQRRYTRDH